jgi:hypothetical protein
MLLSDHTIMLKALKFAPLKHFHLKEIFVFECFFIKRDTQNYHGITTRATGKKTSTKILANVIKRQRQNVKGFKFGPLSHFLL